MIYNPTAAEQGGSIEWLLLPPFDSSQEPSPLSIEPRAPSMTEILYTITFDVRPSIILFRIFHSSRDQYQYSIIYYSDAGVKWSNSSVDTYSQFLNATVSTYSDTRVNGRVGVAQELILKNDVYYALIY